MSDTETTNDAPVVAVSLPTLARRVVAAKLVAEEIKNIEKAAKAELLAECTAAGVRTLDVENDDGTKLATVSKAHMRATLNGSGLLKLAGGGGGE